MFDIHSINAETPVQAILDAEGTNKRAAMTRLACQVFGKADGRILRAYTQFTPDAMASLIEAKRKGVFDYGETIRKLSVGAWSFPNNPKAVLEALDHAAEGNYDTVDLEALDLLDEEGRPVIDTTRLFPTMKKPRTAKAKAPKKETGPSQAELAELKAKREAEAKKAAAAKAAQEAAAAKAAEEAEEAERAAAEEQLRLEQEAAEEAAREANETSHGVSAADYAQLKKDLVNDIVGPVRQHIANLSTNLGEVLEGMHKQTAAALQAVDAEVQQTNVQVDWHLSSLLHNQQKIAAALGALDRNVQQILMYFVDPHMEFEPLDLELSTFTPNGEAPPAGSAAETSPSAAETPESVTETPAADPEPAAEQPEVVEEEPSSEDTTERYTKEELEAMDLADLRSYAESIGVTPARWQKTNVNRILSEYKRQDSEG